MTVYRNLAVLAVASLALAQPASAQNGGLSRKGMLGVAVEAVASGARVLNVAPGSTAEKAGVQSGDIIAALNGITITDSRTLVAEADKLREGGKASVSYQRDGKSRSGVAAATPRPMETYSGAKADYGAVPFRGGLLRDIMVMPDQAGTNAPVVYLLQGYYCGSMEGAQTGHPYSLLAQGLAERGIATYRVEKPGMGDSQGGPHCLDTDFDVELDAFRAGLKALIEERGVRPDRIVLLGHSMGGVQAPLLAAETNGLRGVAVYGTVLRSWHDYMQDLFRLQSFHAYGADPAESEALAEAMRPVLDAIFKTDITLAQIAGQSPSNADLLLEALTWDGKDLILGRTLAYWRGVGAQRLTAAWRDSSSPVLAVYGEVDFASIDDRDHRLIVDIVNHYRPGSGRYATLARTGHGFAIEGTPEEVRRASVGAAPASGQQPYNTELTRVLADWIAELPVPKA